MDYADCKREMVETIEAYLICLDQNLRMLNLLQVYEVLTIEQEKNLSKKTKQIRKTVNALKKRLEFKKDTNYLYICINEILEVFLEVKNNEEELIDILETKAQFPHATSTKLFIEYCICELGIRMFMGFKDRRRFILLGYKLYDKIEGIKS
ncbi:hypothetical protein [Alkaliphilus peptidifermentans]|uniref:Uncharacterized protein n=1 Tax=Alkaliphilus peptidifermentans DSM 18978 TaxID=1120976 RepID=A0A1G5HUI3_9FIRM|nr:hypothetical protein [Alkaliphilus peptidifermentans]SCY67456.1 hypothetical protein SAMN03080606_02146 [Alkaliphilus peptidifermentans DSM 18978]